MAPASLSASRTVIRSIGAAGRNVTWAITRDVLRRTTTATMHVASSYDIPGNGTAVEDYRGEVGVILVNHGGEDVVVTRGMRIAQLVVAPVTRAALDVVDALPGSARGSGRVLFADSDSPALEWWDHQRNDGDVFRTITLKARRVVHWTCPDCSNPFTEKMYEMAERPSCPDCRERAHQEWLATLARYLKRPRFDAASL